MPRRYVRPGKIEMTRQRSFLPLQFIGAPKWSIGRVRRVDPLADVLDLGRVRGALLASVSTCAPWALEIPESTARPCHAVTAGTWLRVNGQPALAADQQPLLLPAHRVRLSSGPDARCRPFDREMKEELMTPAGDLTLPGPGAATTFRCSGYD